MEALLQDSSSSMVDLHPQAASQVVHLADSNTAHLHLRLQAQARSKATSGS